MLDDDEAEVGDDELPDNRALGDNQIRGKNQGVPLEEMVKRVDETNIDYDLLGYLVRALVKENVMGSDGSILVFLPGAPEINQAKATIGNMTSGMPLLLLPLHGGLQPREQNVVFRRAQNAVKVILSTNVAETSITIPDCTVVIDCCREKQSSYDPVNRMPLLVEVFASQASIKQRRGRAGRVREGTCYNLFRNIHMPTFRSTRRLKSCDAYWTKLFFHCSFLVLKQEMEISCNPARSACEEVGDAASFSLSKIGAVERVQPDSIRLTALGIHLACIPAPPISEKVSLFV